MNSIGKTGFRGRLFAAFLVAGLAAATTAFAGGPIYTFDNANRVPYAWNMASWPDGKVPVYTDLGTLGVLSNERVNAMVTFATEQWSGVPTSSFRNAVVGDFSAIDLGDTDASTVQFVIGAWNGGGIDVIYDNDGSIMEQFFGLPPTAVLGITNIDYVAPDGPEIQEAWMVLSGPGIHAADPDGIGFQGVVTHEMGHALNLAHSQSNGAAENASTLDWPMPNGCPAPWTDAPDATQVETMYPISTPEPGNSGEYMGTVDRIDDMSALSDLYPAPGYPGNRGTIKGEILDSTGAPVTGVNVIARNVALPLEDFSSYISGQVSKGEAGPDGTFVLNDLTPGARYVIYTDGLLVGAFSVPRMVVLPGPEEYFNGAAESGNSAIDDRCSWVTLAAVPGSPVTANIKMNRYHGAPTLTIAPAVCTPTDITPDGSIVVGALSSQNGPLFRWDLNAGTFDDIGGFRVGTVAISDDGTKIASTVEDTDGTIKAGIYENGAWTVLPPIPGATPCTQDGITTYNSVSDISGDGSTVVGLSYGDSCFRSGFRAYKWTAAAGSVALPKFSSFNNMSRANGVNYDGSVIVGLDETTSGQWRGAFWKNGVVKLITRNLQNVNSAYDVSRDGQYIVGESSGAATSNQGWRYNVTTNTVELLGVLPSFTDSVGLAISDDHGVIAGTSTSSSTGATAPTIWTPGLHWTDFNSFLLAQGVNLIDTYPFQVSAMSANGQVLVGNLASVFGYVGFVVKTPTSIVCHAPAGSPTQLLTTVVSFPQGLNAALAAGDTLGPCACNTTAPTGTPALTVQKPAAGTAQLEWSAVAAATAYDVVRGSLSVLRTSEGDFSQATTDCLENDMTGTSRDDGDTPAAGDGFWYLVRAASCGGSATFDSGAPSQVGTRDAEILASPFTCP